MVDVWLGILAVALMSLGGLLIYLTITWSEQYRDRRWKR